MNLAFLYDCLAIGFDPRHDRQHPHHDPGEPRSPQTNPNMAGPTMNTPETDRLLQEQFIEQGHLGPHNCPEWLVQHARRLERERNECIQLRSRVEQLEDAIRNLQLTKGRHGTQIAAERLFALLPEQA